MFSHQMYLRKRFPPRRQVPLGTLGWHHGNENAPELLVHGKISIKRDVDWRLDEMPNRREAELDQTILGRGGVYIRSIIFTIQIFAAQKVSHYYMLILLQNSFLALVLSSVCLFMHSFNMLFIE